MAHSGPVMGSGSRLVPSVAAALAAFALVVALAGGGLFFFFLVVAVQSGCGCTSTPSPYAGGPTPTPLPVSESQAAAAARPFTGISMTATYWGTAAGEPIYELSGSGTYGFVDGETGRVLQVFELDEMPDSDATAVTAPAAQAAGAAYLRAAGVSTIGTTVSVVLQYRASIAFYDAVWSDAASGGFSFEVLVSPSTGVVFAFVDLGFAPKVKLAPPVVGSAASARLAQASSYAAGQAPGSPPDFQVVTGTSGEPLFSWWIGYNDGVLSVDAETGQVAIVKWISSR
ncbi:MAG: hypothetical protein ACHQ01_02185 [Candidatus Limnocylindrales bacterium]